MMEPRRPAESVTSELRFSKDPDPDWRRRYRVFFGGSWRGDVFSDAPKRWFWRRGESSPPTGPFPTRSQAAIDLLTGKVVP